MALRSHPDRNDGAAEAEARLKSLNAAYEQVRTPAARAMTDRRLRREEAEAAAVRARAAQEAMLAQMRARAAMTRVPSSVSDFARAATSRLPPADALRWQVAAGVADILIAWWRLG